jgi:hypothetical protein
LVLGAKNKKQKQKKSTNSNLTPCTPFPFQDLCIKQWIRKKCNEMPVKKLNAAPSLHTCQSNGFILKNKHMKVRFIFAVRQFFSVIDNFWRDKMF